MFPGHATSNKQQCVTNSFSSGSGSGSGSTLSHNSGAGFPQWYSPHVPFFGLQLRNGNPRYAPAPWAKHWPKVVMNPIKPRTMAQPGPKHIANQVMHRTRPQ